MTAPSAHVTITTARPDVPASTVEDDVRAALRERFDRPASVTATRSGAARYDVLVVGASAFTVATALADRIARRARRDVLAYSPVLAASGLGRGRVFSVADRVPEAA